MSRKVVKNKKATFALEPDGFSIHTFELSYNCTPMEWKEIKQSLYAEQENRAKHKPVFIYEKSKGRHLCTKYSEHGIRIMLEHNNKQCETFFLRMIVNPRRLIDPESSYIGILPPTEKSIRSLKKAFHRLFEDGHFPNDISSYQLRRVDLCTNIRCDNQKVFRETVRVLRKLPTPPKYERKYYEHENKKKANQYNKHYIRFSCGTHELIIYDKTYQMSQDGMIIAYEELQEGVLRFEVHCERDYIRNIVNEQPSKLETTELLLFMMQISEERIIKHFSYCFDDVTFCQMDEIEKRIKDSSFKQKNKDAMLALSKELRRVQTVDKAFLT